MTTMIYMLFYCANTGLCIENGGYTFQTPKDCIAYMVKLGKGHDTTLDGSKLFIGAKPYRGRYECMKRPASQWQPL